MSISPRQFFANLSAATVSRLNTLERLANVEADWTTAKEDKAGKEQTFLEAVAEMEEHNKDELPAKEWKRLQGLTDDRTRAIERYELVDRDKRKLIKLRDDQTESLCDLCAEHCGSGQKSLDFDGAKDESGPLWKIVPVVRLVGPMMLPHYSKLGIATVDEAKTAMESGRIRELVAKEELEKDVAEFLRVQVASYLDTHGVDHNLGKVNLKKLSVPDAPGKEKPESAPAADDGPKMVELSNPVWDDACRCKGKIDADNAIVGTTRRPWKPFELAAGATFMIFEDQPEVNRLNAVQVIPRDVWEKAHPDKKPRQSMGLPDEPNPLADLLVASDAGELVCGRTVTFALARNKKPKDIPPAAPTPGKPKHKPAHPKGKGGRAAVRRKAEAVAQ